MYPMKGTVLKDQNDHLLLPTQVIILAGSKAVGAVQKFVVTQNEDDSSVPATIEIERYIYDNMGLMEAMGLEDISDIFTLSVIEKKKIAHNYLSCKIAYIETIYDVEQPLVLERASIFVKKVERQDPADLSFMKKRAE